MSFGAGPGLTYVNEMRAKRAMGNHVQSAHIDNEEMEIVTAERPFASRGRVKRSDR
jgi:hypothetical protein